MSDEANLTLDVDHLGVGERSEPVARICVASARAFTRSGGAPVISLDCTSLPALEREVERLRGELDAALRAARPHFGERAAPRREAPAETPRPAPKLSPDLRVADVMTRDVKSVGRNDQLSLVEELMQVGHFRHVVVRDDDGRLAGVISRRDIFFGALAWSMGQGRRAHERALAATAAKDVMRADPVTVDPDATLAQAAELMTRHKIGCLPVLRGGELVGILTEGDFLTLLLNFGDGPTS